MTNNELLNTVIEIASDCFAIDPDTITKETPYISLGIDSLDFVDFILTLESHFDILIPEEEMKNQFTIGATYDFVASVTS